VRELLRGFEGWVRMRLMLGLEWRRGLVLRLEMARVWLEGVGAVLRRGLVVGREMLKRGGLRLGLWREVAGVGLEGVG